MKIPFIYLGLPVGGRSRLQKTWNLVILKFKAKLSAWKLKSISFGGRSAFSISPILSLVLKMSACVVRTCTCIMRDVLWGGGGDTRKIALLSWSSVCKPTDIGGLGIKDLSLFNKSLLGKWRWRFLSEPDHLWCQVIKAKYLGNSNMRESMWWRDVKVSCCDVNGD